MYNYGLGETQTDTDYFLIFFTSNPGIIHPEYNSSSYIYTWWWSWHQHDAVGYHSLTLNCLGASPIKHCSKHCSFQLRFCCPVSLNIMSVPCACVNMFTSSCLEVFLRRCLILIHIFLFLQYPAYLTMFSLHVIHYIKDISWWLSAKCWIHPFSPTSIYWAFTNFKVKVYYLNCVYSFKK